MLLHKRLLLSEVQQLFLFDFVNRVVLLWHFILDFFILLLPSFVLLVLVVLGFRCADNCKLLVQIPHQSPNFVCVVFDQDVLARLRLVFVVDLVLRVACLVQRVLLERFLDLSNVLQ